MLALVVTATDVMAEKPVTVYAVNYPLKYFCERIGGDQVEVFLPVPKDIDPAYWNPGIDDILAYQQADLILLNGAGYAQWTEKVSLPRAILVNTSKKFADQYIRIKGAVTHSHGAEGEHTHENVAFTTWLDFRLAAWQAEAIYQALCRARPDAKVKFDRNFSGLQRNLVGLDQKLKEIVAQREDQPLIVSHPVYDYFARRYGLNIRSVHWEPDEMPDETQWRDLQAMRQDHGAQWMVWEGAPLPETASRLAGMGIGVVVFSPGGNVPSKGDFVELMQVNIANLAKAFE
jgi:zinc transport system substrate-binding protein